MKCYIASLGCNEEFYLIQRFDFKYIDFNLHIPAKADTTA